MRRKGKQKKMRCGKIVPGLTILFILLTGFPAGFQLEYVYAAEPAYETGISEDAQTEKWIQQFSFDEVQNYIDQMFPEKNYNLEEMLRKITEGDYEEFLSQAGKMLRDKLFRAVESGRKYLIPIVFLAFLAALFHNFSQVFESGQLSETGFYVLYLLLIALCLKVFLAVTEWVSTGVEGLTAFMGVFCPLYFLAVAIAKGSVTAIAFYYLSGRTCNCQDPAADDPYLHDIETAQLSVERRLSEQICRLSGNACFLDAPDNVGCCSRMESGAGTDRSVRR